jgi:hypothetical protein
MRYFKKKNAWFILTKTDLVTSLIFPSYLFPFSKHCLIKNELSPVMWVKLPDPKLKPINTTQNQKRKNEDQ